MKELENERAIEKQQRLNKQMRKIKIRSTEIKQAKVWKWCQGANARRFCGLGEKCPEPVPKYFQDLHAAEILEVREVAVEEDKGDTGGG